MADFGRGIKAGVAVAAVYLIVSVILELTGFSDQFPTITMATGLEVQLESTVLSLVILSVFSRILRGIIFGAIFAALYNLLPGTTSIRKGVVLSSFLWIVTVIQVIYTTLGWPWQSNGGSYAVTDWGLTVCLSSVGLALVNIIAALVFGALAGLLWDKFRPKELMEGGKGSAVLLVSFILGGLVWVSATVGFFIVVVIHGATLIEPGPSWWYGILSTSVVFLGPVGWILALVAWRKTRRGESGFKWGVAGGVIMALTGIMLLPGILAIIGGVLSGRKPISESSTAEIGQ